jgi:hypothetical protein
LSQDHEERNAAGLFRAGNDFAKKTYRPEDTGVHRVNDQLENCHVV